MPAISPCRMRAWASAEVAIVLCRSTCSRSSPRRPREKSGARRCGSFFSRSQATGKARPKAISICTGERSGVPSPCRDCIAGTVGRQGSSERRLHPQWPHVPGRAAGTAATGRAARRRHAFETVGQGRTPRLDLATSGAWLGRTANERASRLGHSRYARSDPRRNGDWSSRPTPREPLWSGLEDGLWPLDTRMHPPPSPIRSTAVPRTACAPGPRAPIASCEPWTATGHEKAPTHRSAMGPVKTRQ